jgi:hypothetical protein
MNSIETNWNGQFYPGQCMLGTEKPVENSMDVYDDYNYTNSDESAVQSSFESEMFYSGSQYYPSNGVNYSHEAEVLPNNGLSYLGEGFPPKILGNSGAHIVRDSTNFNDMTMDDLYNQSFETHAPCQGPQPWNYAYCYGFYGEDPCQFSNVVDIEDFM